MRADKAEALGLKPRVAIKAFASGGLDPAYMGLGPIPAVRKVLAATGMTIDDIDLIELNEAFAAQAIGCMRELNIPVDKPNPLDSSPKYPATHHADPLTSGRRQYAPP